MYPYLSVVTLFVGLTLTGVFFVNQMSAAKSDKNGGLAIQLTIGGGASVALALATLFAMLSFGLYV